ncbi:MAG: hypothetical protein E5X67_11775 [Mesorhizobium sp.]|nr:MAG: hypothetical protein E5X67_11775 [Mesorhizobium sp.]
MRIFWWRKKGQDWVIKTTATAIAALEAWQWTASRRRAIRDLTPEQLRDIGHAEAPAPVLAAVRDL